MSKIRIGRGWDTHRLVEDRKLILGGVEIPYGKGLLGHSDADVLLHCIMDAVLGALALGDIGKFFPDTDLAFKDANSLILLKEVLMHMKAAGFVLGNLDCTIICEKPRLAHHIQKMRVLLAKSFESDIDQISIKATTREGLGPEGQGTAITAMASIILIAE